MTSPVNTTNASFTLQFFNISFITIKVLLLRTTIHVTIRLRFEPYLSYESYLQEEKGSNYFPSHSPNQYHR